MTTRLAKAIGVEVRTALLLIVRWHWKLLYEQD
jgi:hypothetical protein